MAETLILTGESVFIKEKLEGSCIKKSLSQLSTELSYSLADRFPWQRNKLVKWSDEFSLLFLCVPSSSQFLKDWWWCFNCNNMKWSAQWSYDSLSSSVIYVRVCFRWLYNIFWEASPVEPLNVKRQSLIDTHINIKINIYLKNRKWWKWHKNRGIVKVFTSVTRV